MKPINLLIAFLMCFFLSNAQELCDELQTEIISQTSNEVSLQSVGIFTIETINIEWSCYNQDGLYGQFEDSPLTLSNLNQNEYLIIIQYFYFGDQLCQVKDSLFFDQQWNLETISEDLPFQCTLGVCTDVSQFGQQGSFATLEECQQECESTGGGDNPYECLLGSCTDVSQFGQEGSFATLEECEKVCENTSGDSPYECLLGNCTDVSVFGQNGSFATLEECEKVCESTSGDSSFECIIGSCVDVGQIGQEGSFATLQECEEKCQNSSGEDSSFECVIGSCVDVGQFGQEGSFATLEECENNCEDLFTDLDEFSNQVMIAPNPFNQFTQIYLNQVAISYHLFDINGRKIKSENINSKQLTFHKNQLKPGLYFIYFISKNDIVQKKLFIK